MSQQRHGSTPGNGAEPAFPALPEATIARLPEYLRALHNLGEGGSDTISSEGLAAAAGVWCVRVHEPAATADAVRVVARMEREPTRPALEEGE